MHNPTLLSPPERNRYFYGLMMDVERFQRDQHYFNGKRHLLNRYVTGGGVVCGLGLAYHSGTSTLTLSPGVAIDLFGREIVVPAATSIDITQLTDAAGKPAGPVPAGSTVIVSLAYLETKTDPVAVLVPDCDSPGACAPSTIEEGFRVLVRVASGNPSDPACLFGSSLLSGKALQQAIAKNIAADYQDPPPTPKPDPSILLGRLDLLAGTLDAVSDRPIVYNNELLFELIFCLSERVAQLEGTTLNVVSGNNQSATASTALANPLVVEVDDGGNPLASATTPTFTVSSGGGSLGAVTPAGPGQFQITWTLGTSGAQTVTVTSPQAASPLTFNATISA